MSESRFPSPTCSTARIDSELQRWSRLFSGEEYYYGHEPGPVARRTVRYHHGVRREGATALDAGCGEGQDLAFLAERGYTAEGIEFTSEGVEKTRQLLHSRKLSATVLHQDLRHFHGACQYDLVLAVNSLQFLGTDALPCLDRLMAAVAPGGVIGLSLFGRDAQDPEVEGTIFRVTLEDLLHRFSGWQPLEAAKLWQWSIATNQPQPFVTLIARKTPQSGQNLIALG